MLLAPSNGHDNTWSPLEFVAKAKGLVVGKCGECNNSGSKKSEAAGEIAIGRQAHTVLTVVLEFKDIVSAG